MLQYLRIRNFGIFQDAEVELLPGLSAFTGETGAGKSMIVDAVMSCLGQRTSKDFLRTGEERAVVELLANRPRTDDDRELDDGVLSILGEQDDVALQRDILADRSYMRVNGKVVSSGMAQEIGSRLVDIHGQQEHHSLMKPQNYLSILDSLDRQRVVPLRSRFIALYRQRQGLLSDIRELGRGGPERQREIDLLLYQVNEIADAKIREGEEAELRTEYQVLSSQKRLIELAQTAYNLLYASSRGQESATEQLSLALSALKKASSIDPAASPAYEAVEQASFTLEVALDSLREYQKRLSVQPDKLNQVAERLDLLQKLKSKYGESEKAILQYEKDARQSLHKLMHSEEALARLHEELGRIEDEMARTGSELTSLRRELAQNMSREVTSSLGELGMPGGTFMAQVENEEDEQGVRVGGLRLRPFNDGFDKVSFLFSANLGESPSPVNKVASGGELSRLMLAIKSHLEENDPVPTLIFDEIDAGIGGDAGQAVAEKLWKLGRRHQVLCVTHLASIAALADHHYVVQKSEHDGRTVADVRLLSQEGRVSEIARMLSGSGLSISSDHARALLRRAQEKKVSED